ncbi:recombinase family protein [Microvirga sp. 0TCS3.31]
MAVYGYARVSHASQCLDVQIDALRAAGCSVIRSEKKSATTRDGRVELQTLLDFVREGDTIYVTRVDRIARSIADLQDILRVLKSKGVALKATEQPIDTSTPLGKCMLDLLGIFAELETNLRRERQTEAIRRIREIDSTKPKHERTYQGRPPTINPDEIRQLRDQGHGATAIAQRLGIGRASVYRVLGTKIQESVEQPGVSSATST